MCCVFEIMERVEEEGLTRKCGDGFCTQCRSANIEFGDDKSCGNSFIRHYLCADCGHEGEIHYVEVWAGSK